jgi:hypothetical protein
MKLSLAGKCEISQARKAKCSHSFVEPGSKMIDDDDDDDDSGS